MATKKEAAKTAAFVLCAGTLDGATRYPAGCVVEGLPDDVLKANTHWLDAAPAAVEAAKANGAQVLAYEG